MENSKKSVNAKRVSFDFTDTPDPFGPSVSRPPLGGRRASDSDFTVHLQNSNANRRGLIGRLFRPTKNRNSATETSVVDMRNNVTHDTRGGVESAANCYVNEACSTEETDIEAV